MTKREKVKAWFCANKKVIITATGIIVGGVVIYAIGKTCKDFMHSDTQKFPGFTITENGGLTVEDLGKLGEEFIKHEPSLTPETHVLEVGSFVFGD